MARWGRWLVLGLVAGAGAVAGAVWDWYNWHPMSAIMATLVAIPLVVIGALMLIVRARRSRQVGQVVLALGLGIVLGQILGPSRPDLNYAEGTITVTTDSPTVGTATASASCSFDADGQFQVSGDPNLRLQLAADDPSMPANVDGREFVGISVRVGDRWQETRTPRSDGIKLLVWVSYVVDGRAEAHMAATETSTVSLQGTARDGTLTFSGLEPSQREGELGDLGDPIDIAGTITWAC